MGGFPRAAAELYHPIAGGRLARHNYSFEKRQRDLAKKQKKEEKRQRKLERPDGAEGDGEAGETNPDTTTETETDTPAE